LENTPNSVPFGAAVVVVAGAVVVVVEAIVVATVVLGAAVVDVVEAAAVAGVATFVALLAHDEPTRASAAHAADTIERVVFDFTTKTLPRR
jgi:hypothetical protein